MTPLRHPAGIATLLLLLVATAAPLSAQETAQNVESSAFLQSQPRVATGVPVLPANTMRHAEASYLFRDAITFRLFVTADDPDVPSVLPDGSTWQELLCGVGRVESVPRHDQRVYRLLRPRYTLFALIPGEFDGVCDVLSAFVQPFEFFLGLNPGRIRTLAPPPEFPAVLDLSRLSN